MIFKNGTIYDILKWCALVALNAIGTAYKALAAIWGWPYGEEVMQTCAILSVFIGALIGISGARYSKENGTEYGSDEEKEHAQFLQELFSENPGTAKGNE